MFASIVIVALLAFALHQLTDSYYSFGAFDTYKGPIDKVRGNPILNHNGGRTDITESTAPGHCDTFDGDIQRCNVLVPSANSDCMLHSWFYSPSTAGQGDKKVPVIVMSHGLGGQKDMGLHNYAMEFARDGNAVVVLDYRHFGGSYCNSDNSMRNFINPWFHVEDIVSVVNFVSSGSLERDYLDTTSIGLWGTSFAGGHVLVAANRLDDKIKCIVSQVPHLDGKAASKRSIADRGAIGSLRVAVIAIADFIAGFLGYSPVFVEIAGVKGDVSYMTLSEDQLKSYFSKHPKVYLGGWQNLAPARTMLAMSFYNPIEYVANVKVPILFVGASQDAICPMATIRDAESRNSLVRVVEVNTTHFDIYAGQPFAHVVGEMKPFYKAHLMK